MRFFDVHSRPDAYQYLYELLAEREPHQSISHKEMPAFEKHCAFVDSRPYQAWYLIEAVLGVIDDVALDVEIVGAVYLTHQREIGIGILKKYQGRGFGKSAVEGLMEKHPGRFLANINPANEASIALFKALGFGQIQITMEKP